MTVSHDRWETHTDADGSIGMFVERGASFSILEAELLLGSLDWAIGRARAGKVETPCEAAFYPLPEWLAPTARGEPSF